MLNEIMEYKAYIEDPVSDSPRLQSKLLTEGFDKTKCALNGIGQILTVIARGFMFETDSTSLFDEDGLITDEGIDAVKDVLKIWCGFKKDTVTSQMPVREWFSDHPSAIAWLREFFIYNYKRYKERITDKQAEEYWEKWSDVWDGKLDSDNDYMAESTDLNNIIADAILKGRLKERYCIIKKYENSNKIQTMEDLYDQLFTYRKGTQDKIKQRMLRNVIAYRIFETDHPDGQDEVVLQKLRLFGWYGIDSNRGKTTAWCSDRFFYKDDRPVINSRIIHKFSKFSVDKDFLDHFEFRLIDKEDTSKYEKDYLILKDAGHGDDRPLEIINI